METTVGQDLLNKKLSLALAESCTGGLITSRLTDNEVKIQQIGVDRDIIQEHGAVSQETAIAMATGIRQIFKTSIGIGVTGIAGPGGATSEKPVGLVYIAIDGPSGHRCYKHQFIGHRTDIKFRASQAALDMIRHYVHGLTLQEDI